MDKIKITKRVTGYPMPVVLVGSLVEGKANFMAVGWSTRVNPDPPIVGVAITKSHHTVKGIIANKAFSVNIPGVELMDRADYCGIYSGGEVDKSSIFNVFYGELKTAPMIRECPVTLECRLVDTIELSEVFFFLGEIVEAYSEECYLNDGKLDITKTKPFVLTVPDGNYRPVGEPIGKAWEVGEKLKPK
ncbi:MAG TPA: flavin reductase family protein [bacterium]|nr:flavin reductase family protein [bacterium]